MAMNRRNRLEGVNDVLGNLNEEIQGIENRSMKGLMKAGLRIQRESQKLAPVLTGNLKASAYTRRAGEFVRLDTPSSSKAAPKPSGTVPPKRVEIGFTAAYAAAVHENLESRHENGQAKYLETALRENKFKIVNDVRENADVGA